VLEGKWRGWWHIRGGEAPLDAEIASVSRDSNKLDVFVVASNGTAYTAAWDENVKESEWRGWWPIGGLTAPPGSAISAVSRDPNKLDVFVVGNDGHVYTAAWDHNVSQGKWRGWWNIGGVSAPPGSAVSAVSRDPNKLDVFVVGNDGHVYTAAWDHNVADGKWRGWWRIAP
jgi:hypothetical protein